MTVGEAAVYVGLFVAVGLIVLGGMLCSVLRRCDEIEQRIEALSPRGWR